ncbi:OmpA family protein [Streptomyces zaomyceticus]|uniref:OmpA family protein n=1 Tax=Streptomyces zaomyceticus TaxID=68286 RepID=UPI0034181271
MAHVGLRASLTRAPATLTLLAAVNLNFAAAAHADGMPGEPHAKPLAAAPPKVDPNDPDLRLKRNSALAAPRVLDIESVVGSEGGQERREETRTTLRFVLQAGVLFPKDSADLSDQARARLESLAAEIGKHHPRAVQIFGYTDDLGTHAHGLVLSGQRASVVKNVLAQRLNDPDIAFDVRGYAESHPVADNSTEDGRSRNRRVEIALPRAFG